jgi:predicted transcriptional regulator of viral defense system
MLMRVELPEIYQRDALRLEGFADDEVRRLLRSGRLTPVRRGCCVLGAQPENPRDRYALQVRAALAHLADDAVASHASAAALHGLPTWGVRLDRVHVTRARRNGGRAGRRVHVHSAPLDPEDVDLVGGVPVTSVARTVVDLARRPACRS